MSRNVKAETISIAAAVLFSVLFFAFIVCIGWAGAKAETIIVHDGSQSYACQTSKISQAPYNCKPIKEQS